jgi:hypothetical protein
MTVEYNGRLFYTPQEAAHKLGISVAMLRYFRLEGRIVGTRVGTTTLYTEEQLNQVDLSPRKRGPKIRGGEETYKQAA